MVSRLGGGRSRLSCSRSEEFLVEYLRFVNTLLIVMDWS